MTPKRRPAQAMQRWLNEGLLAPLRSNISVANLLHVAFNMLVPKNKCKKSMKSTINTVGDLKTNPSLYQSDFIGTKLKLIWTGP